MGVSDTVRTWLLRGLVKASGTAVVPEWINYNFVVPTFQALAGEGYRANGAVFGAVSALAFAFPEAKPRVYQKQGGGKTPLDTHELQALLDRPNSQQGAAELLLYTITYMAVGGNCYLYKVRNKAGRVIELWPLHDGQITVVQGKGKLVDHYELILENGQTEIIDPHDIVHLKWPSADPLAPHKGLAPLMAVAREVDTDNEATRYLFALLKNDAVPRIAITIPETLKLSDAARARLKAEWQERYGGENRGKPAFLEGGMDIKSVGLSLTELAFEALRRVPEARICAAFRVPAIVAGVNVGLENSTYSNFEEAVRSFTERTLVPLWRMVAETLNASLLCEYADSRNLTIEFDLSTVVALSEKQAELEQRVNEAVKAGWMTVNEARAKIGLPLDTNGNVYLRGIAVTTEPAKPVAGGKGAKAANPVGKKIRLYAGLERKAARNMADAINRAQRQVRSEVARRLESSLGVFFADLADRAIGRLYKSAPAGSSEKKDAVRPEDVISEDDFAALERVFRGFISELCQASWDYWDTALGVVTDFDPIDPAVKIALARAGDRIKDISKTTLDQVRELLDLANEAGWSIDEIVRGDPESGIAGLREIITETYQDRARTVARTELGYAQNYAAAGRFKTFGVEKVLVLDNGLTDDDEPCQLANGAKWTVAEAEANPLEHPNCTRAFAPWFEDEE